MKIIAKLFLVLLFLFPLFLHTQSSIINPNVMIEIYVEVDNMTGNAADDVFIFYYPNGTTTNNSLEIFRYVDYHFLFTSLNETHLLAFSGLNQDPGGFSASNGVNTSVDITITDESFIVLECGIHDQSTLFLSPTLGDFVTVTSYSYVTEYTTISSGSFNVTETVVISSVQNHTSETTITTTENTISGITVVVTETAPFTILPMLFVVILIISKIRVMYASRRNYRD